jgi:hypothetical protein
MAASRSETDTISRRPINLYGPRYAGYQGQSPWLVSSRSEELQRSLPAVRAAFIANSIELAVGYCGKKSAPAVRLGKLHDGAKTAAGSELGIVIERIKRSRPR